MAAMLRAPLVVLFLAVICSSYAQNVSEVWVATGAELVVECPLRVEQRVSWRRDGAALADAGDERAADGALTARLTFSRATRKESGLYTCSEPPEHSVRVHVSTTTLEPEFTTDLIDDLMNAPPFWFDLNRPFNLTCKTADAEWSKDNKPLLSSPRYEIRVVDGHSVLDLKVRSTEEDAGVYRCGNEIWGARAKAVLRLPSDAGAVEGQKLRLACRVLGRPAPQVTWRFSNATLNGTAVDMLGPERVKIAGASGEELVVETAQREDAGVYSCAVEEQPWATPAQVTVRIKDKYAALWPFLGICAEVLLLCAVILVYERRRSKSSQQGGDSDDDRDQKKS